MRDFLQRPQQSIRVHGPRDIAYDQLIDLVAFELKNTERDTAIDPEEYPWADEDEEVRDCLERMVRRSMREGLWIEVIQLAIILLNLDRIAAGPQPRRKTLMEIFAENPQTTTLNGEPVDLAVVKPVGKAFVDRLEEKPNDARLTIAQADRAEDLMKARGKALREMMLVVDGAEISGDSPGTPLPDGELDGFDSYAGESGVIYAFDKDVYTSCCQTISGECSGFNYCINPECYNYEGVVPKSGRPEFGVKPVQKPEGSVYCPECGRADVAWIDGKPYCDNPKCGKYGERLEGEGLTLTPPPNTQPTAQSAPEKA